MIVIIIVQDLRKDFLHWDPKFMVIKAQIVTTVLYLLRTKTATGQAKFQYTAGEK